MKRFIVQYELEYEHRVQVGINAKSPKEAIKKAQQAFENGTIWDDSKAMPLLFDDYEETDGHVLEFEVVAEVDTWPAPDFSVVQWRRNTAALRACRLLVEAYRRGEASGGSVAWEEVDAAHEVALAALGESESGQG